MSEPVDGLVDREASTGLEHPVKLGDRFRLRPDVDQHRTGGDRVDRGVFERRKVVGGGADELATVKHAGGHRERSRAIEKILRDVVEDHSSRRPHPLERTECDEAVACADVEEGLARRDRRVVEDLVSDWTEEVERPAQELRVAAVLSVQQPFGPLVEHPGGHPRDATGGLEERAAQC